jgi:hypothetical protein
VRPLPLTGAVRLPRRARVSRPGNGVSVPGVLILGLLCLPVLSSSPLCGQTTGRIQGSIVDLSNGQPLAGVLIRIEALDRSTLSSEAGRFVLAGLPAGRHDVWVELVGFKSLELESVVVRAARASELALELEPTACLWIRFGWRPSGFLSSSPR